MGWLMYFLFEENNELGHSNNQEKDAISAPNNIADDYVINFNKSSPKNTMTKTPTINYVSDRKTEVVRVSSNHDIEEQIVYLQDNYAIDMNGNEIAVPFSPESGADTGAVNEYGESIVAEFQPEETELTNSLLEPSLEENYISSIEGDFANPIMLEDSSGENEAHPIFPESNRVESLYGEDVAVPFYPENNPE